MRTETRTIYNFDELPSESAKEKAREWWRNASASDFNADYCLTDFCAYARHLGFDVSENDISYSGFWSQGDGASFAGQYCLSGYGLGPAQDYANDERLFSIELEIKKSRALFYRRLIRAIPCEFMADIRSMFTNRNACAYVVISRSNSRYSHEMTMRSDGGENVLDDILYRLGDDGELCDVSAIEHACEEFAENILSDARSLAQHLYYSLEREYEWSISDECVDENIIANEYEFDENGEIL